ncbi:MAG: deoxyribose-phosphate aldolase [Deltaproteobacteria bacterium]|nr:deoxyribose-phosphate aldolase [Deltaproteobacteria bacterium]
MEITPQKLASSIDHTILRADTDYACVDRFISEADRYRFASVCVNPWHVARAVAKLKGTGVDVSTVIGFPLGANTSEVKVYEAVNAFESGAARIGMVINSGAVKSNDFDTVFEDIKMVRSGIPDAILEVIIETALLSENEIIISSKICMEAGVDLICSSTGFSTLETKLSDVALIRRIVGLKKGVKASGNFRNLDSALKLFEAGADRLGCSGVVIVDEISGVR